MPSYTIVAGLPSATGYTTRRLLRALAISRLWAVYQRWDGVHDQIYASYSDDEGLTWTEEQVTTGTRDWSSPTAAVDSLGNLHIVFGNSDFAPRNLWYRVRTVAGWGGWEAVTTLIAPRQQFQPSIAIDSEDNIHLTWFGTGWGTFLTKQQVLYRKRVPAGWLPIELVTDNSRQQYKPEVVVDEAGIIHILWVGLGWGTFILRQQVLYRQRTAVGWQAVELVTDINSHQDAESTITVDAADDVHIAWTGTGWGINVLVDNVQYRKRTAGAWQAQEALTDMGSKQGVPVIAIDTLNTITVVWEGLGWDFPARSQIRVRRKVDGAAWQAHITITDDNHFHRHVAAFPAILCPGTGYAFLYHNDTDLGVAGDYQFFTLGVTWLPSVTTDLDTGVLDNAATLNGTLDADGVEACECGFEYGETIAYGNITPTDSKRTGETFSQLIAGLLPGTLYHFRAFATNSAGTGYGADRSFTTTRATTPVFSRAHALSREEL